MFTKNFNVDVSHFVRKSDPTTTSAANLKSIGGTSPSVLNSCYEKSFYMYSPFRNMEYFFPYNKFVDVPDSTKDDSLYGGYGVMFGDGNTEPTVDDLTLSGNAIAGLTSSNITIAVSEVAEETYHEKTCIYTITNNTGAEITIGEIGLFNCFYGQEQQYGKKYRQCPYMVERTALESPVTIPVDGVGQITYTIRMNYPVA